MTLTDPGRRELDVERYTFPLLLYQMAAKPTVLGLGPIIAPQNWDSVGQVAETKVPIQLSLYDEALRDPDIGHRGLQRARAPSFWLL